MAKLSPRIPVITLSANVLNTRIKKQKLTEWINRQDLIIYDLEETHFKYRNISRLKVKEQKKIYYANNQKKAKVPLF